VSAAPLTADERTSVAWRALCAKHGDAAQLYSLRRDHPKQFSANPVFQARWATIWADLRQLLGEDDAALLLVEQTRKRGREALSEQIEQGAKRAEKERRSDEQRRRRAKRPVGDALSKEIIEVLSGRPNISAKGVEKLLRRRVGPDKTIRKVTAEAIEWVKADGTLKTTPITRLASRVSRLKHCLEIFANQLARIPPVAGES
jgi:hypothetical protein